MSEEAHIIVSSKKNVIDEILEREGGYKKHSADRGGATNYGITRAVLAQWRKKPVTDGDVKRLNVSEASEIYQAMYIDGPGFDKVINEHLRSLLVDCGVNHGPKCAIQWLQEAVGVYADGKIGLVTLGALADMNMSLVIRRVLANRIRFYGKIITKNRSQAVFAEGWLNRAASFLDDGWPSERRVS